MDLLSILVLIGIAVWIFFSIRYMIRMHKRGGCPSCGGNMETKGGCQSCMEKGNCEICKKNK